MFRTKKRTVTERARDKAAFLAGRGVQVSHDVEERAADLAGRLRESDALARAKDKGGALAERLRESDAVARAKDKGGDVAARVQQKLRDAEIEERARELAERMRESDAYERGAAKARYLTDEGLGKVGGWLATSGAAGKLGVQPRKRRFPAWLAALLGAGVGYGIAMFTAPKSGPEFRDDFVSSAQQLTRETADVIKARIGEDPRTSSLPELSVNVAEGTVFVRGTVPGNFDETALREVITGVPGVRDVDLQVTSAT